MIDFRLMHLYNLLIKALREASTCVLAPSCQKNDDHKEYVNTRKKILKEKASVMLNSWRDSSVTHVSASQDVANLGPTFLGCACSASQDVANPGPFLGSAPQGVASYRPNMRTILLTWSLRARLTKIDKKLSKAA